MIVNPGIMRTKKTPLPPHNLLLQSNALKTSPWTATGSPTGAQNLSWIDGTTNGWTVTDSGAPPQSSYHQTATVTAGRTYFLSCFVRKTVGVQSSYPCLTAYASANTTFAICTIDTTNGIATAWTAYTGITKLNGTVCTVSSYNADWWRVVMQFTPTATSYDLYLVAAATANATQSTGTFTDALGGSCGMGGFQLNIDTLTSYTPTTTTPV